MFKNSSLRIGKIGNVSIFVGWSWLIVLWLDYSRNSGPGGYKQKGWIFAELAAFIIMVCLHELTQAIFGMLAGGTVTEVHIAFLGRGSNLAVPQRPWPIILASLGGILGYAVALGVTIPMCYTFFVNRHGSADAAQFSLICLVINLVLLGWAVAPVYPLEGGKILRALLWYIFGRIRSLQIACVLGLLGTLCIVGLVIWLMTLGFNPIMWGLGAVMIGLQCIMGFREARILGVMGKIPRREDVVCPHCKQNPFYVNTITCVCGRDLDPFETRGQCGDCGSVTSVYACPHCRQQSLIAAWFGPTGLFEVQNTAPLPVITTNDQPKPEANPPPPAPL